MLSLDAHIQNRLMVVSLPPCLFEPSHLVIVQPPSHDFLKLFPTYLLSGFQLLIRLQSWLEPRLHPYSERCIKRDSLRITPYFWCFALVANREELVALRLHVEGSRAISRGYAKKGLFSRDSFSSSGKDTELVAAQVSIPS